MVKEECYLEYDGSLCRSAVSPRPDAMKDDWQKYHVPTHQPFQASCAECVASGGTPTLLLSGCRSLVDCLPPMVDLCQFDVQLEAALQVAWTEVRLSTGRPWRQLPDQLPFALQWHATSAQLPISFNIVRSTTATCPMNNTDALQGLQVNLPPLG